MRPTFGCRLHELIFAPNNNSTAVQARRYVEDALGMWATLVILQRWIRRRISFPSAWRTSHSAKAVIPSRKG